MHHSRPSSRIALVLTGLALVGLLFSGCYRQSFSGPGAPPPGTPPTKTMLTHHFVAGLISLNSDMDLRYMCGSGQATKVQTYFGLPAFLLSFVTAALWVPTTTRVWCSGGVADADQNPPALAAE